MMGVVNSGNSIHNNTVDNEGKPRPADRSLSNNNNQLSHEKPHFNKHNLKTSQGSRRRPPMPQDTFALNGLTQSRFHLKNDQQESV